MSIPQTVNFEFYAALVGLYAERKAKDPQDRFHAFTSIEYVLQEDGPYHTGFVQCLPVDQLDSALLWISEDPHPDRAKIVDTTTGRTAVSWSWVGWYTSIEYEERASTEDFAVSGLVDWHFSTDENGIPDWVSCRNLQSQMTRSPNAKSFRQCGHTPTTQSHLTATGNNDSSYHHRYLSQVNYLHGRASTAEFRVSNTHPYRLLLTNSTEQFAGVWLSREADVSPGQTLQFIAISKGSLEIDTAAKKISKRRRLQTKGKKNRHLCEEGCRETSCELVHAKFNFEDLDPLLPLEFSYKPQNEIRGKNCGRRWRRLKSVMLDKQYERGSYYTYYNALWVQRQGGVLERRGLARICQSVFEEDASGWTDVVLS